MDRGTVERHVNNPKGNRGNLTNEGKGRRKGVPNKFTGTLKEAILASFDRVGGVDYLEKQARENPQAYMSLLAKVLPMQISGPNEGPIFIVTGVMRTDEEEELYNQQQGLINRGGVNGSSGTIGHEPATIDHEPATDHEPAPINSTAGEVITGVMRAEDDDLAQHDPQPDPPVASDPPVEMRYAGTTRNGIPTRERYGDDFERALENFSRHKAVEEHNERLAREHDASVEKHIRDTARRDAERRYEDHKASRITELKARLDAVNGELRNRGEVELQTLTEEQMARLEGMTVMPDNTGSLSTEEYAAARHRRDRAAKLLEMELAFAADMKRKGRR